MPVTSANSVMSMLDRAKLIQRETPSQIFASLTNAINQLSSPSFAQLLSALRAEFPHVVSLLMDEATLTRHRSLAAPGTGRPPSAPHHYIVKAEGVVFLRGF